MGQILHGRATTTHAVRKAIQRSKASLSQLSRTYGINPKTVQKWRQRQTVEDRKTGPKYPRSTLLNETEEALIVAFRRSRWETRSGAPRRPIRSGTAAGPPSASRVGKWARNRPDGAAFGEWMEKHCLQGAWHARPRRGK